MILTKAALRRRLNSSCSLLQVGLGRLSRHVFDFDVSVIRQKYSAAELFNNQYNHICLMQKQIRWDEFSRGKCGDETCCIPEMTVED